MEWHTASADDVLKHLNTTVERGLTQVEAERRLQQHGLNELVDRGTKNPWKILFEQFTSVMVLILIAAAVVSLLVGDLKDAVAILAIVVLFGILGFTQEYRAENPVDPRWNRVMKEEVSAVITYVWSHNHDENVEFSSAVMEACYSQNTES